MRFLEHCVQLAACIEAGASMDQTITDLQRDHLTMSKVACGVGDS